MGKRGAFRSSGAELPMCNCPASERSCLTYQCTCETIDGLFHLAHQAPQWTTGPKFPFTCPACGTSFANESETREEQPPVDLKAYEKLHHCVVWHQGPLVPVEPRRIVVDTLHFLLSCVKKMYKVFILAHVHTNDQV